MSMRITARNESMKEIVEFIEDPVLRQLARSAQQIAHRGSMLRWGAWAIRISAGASPYAFAVWRKRRTTAHTATFI